MGLGRVGNQSIYMPMDPTGEFDGTKVLNLKAKNLGKIDGAETFEISFQSTGASQDTKFIWNIVPSRGFITPLIRVEGIRGRKRGQLINYQWNCSNYFQPSGSELWFPATCKYQGISSDNDESTQVKETYQFMKDQVKLNVEISADRFKIALKRGETVLDGKDQADQISYEVLSDFGLSLQGLDELEQNEAVARNKKLPESLPEQNDIPDK